ncbi:MAG: pilus assembly PilX N-terminal domain-containing protein [Patescibacteria group bacterium]
MKYINRKNLLGHKSCSRPGSALILTMFILAGMLVIAMSGSYLVLLGIKAGGIQSQSMRAYFAAEAGMEYFLWELRQNGYEPDVVSATPIMNGSLPAGGAYEIYYTAYPPLTFRSIGDFQNVRRSVEVRM